MDCLDSVCSDMSVFHNVSDIRELSGPTFFKLAYRLPAYEGASRRDLEGWLEDAQIAEVEAEERKYPPRYVNDVDLASMREKEGRVSEISDGERAATLEELVAAGPAVPAIGQDVPIFTVIRVGD